MGTNAASYLRHWCQRCVRHDALVPTRRARAGEISAAVTRDADEAGGLDQALQSLKEQPFVPWPLAAVGIGFVAFGLYCFARARYERD